jgi:hypothetical protein
VAGVGELMHRQAFDFIAARARELGRVGFVLEIGARNINGTIKNCFDAERYVGIDVAPGPGVDVVASGADYVPDAQPDVIVCCEVLEHTEEAASICRRAIENLAPGGVLLLTMAGTGRAPHSAVDGGALRADEFYRNVSVDELTSWLADAPCTPVVTANTQSGDTYAVAVKSGAGARLRLAPAPRPNGRSMRALVIGGGAGWSTKDVENGVLDGLRSAGVEAAPYILDQRIMASGEFLKRCWKRVKHITPDVQAPTSADILLHAVQDSLTRALLHEVDWVVLVSAMFVPRPFLEILQRAGLPVAVLLTESPYDQEKELKWAAHADLVWTNERSSVGAFRAVQPRSFYLPHAMRPQVHRPDVIVAEDAPAHDVVFVGSGFSERIELLSAIDWTGIDLGLYGNWQKLGPRSKLRKYVRDGVVDNETAAALYRRTKVGLNLYRESIGWGKTAARIAHAESMNPRAYELAACGCFHLSQAREEVGEVFGDLVPTFGTAREASALIRTWLANDAGRADVSRRLPAAVAAHSWTARGAQMASDLRAALPFALDRVARRVSEKQGRSAVAA